MLATPNCYERRCKHFLGVGGDGPEIMEYLYCLAFPHGIPEEIAYEDNKHLAPVEGQGNEIVFEEEE